MISLKFLKSSALKARPCRLLDSLLMQKLNLLGEQLFCPKALRHGACTCGVQSASSMQMETASFQAGKLAKDKNAEANAFAKSCTPPTKSAKSKCSVGAALSQTSRTVCLKTDPLTFIVFLHIYDLLISYILFIVFSFCIMRPVSSWD